MAVARALYQRRDDPRTALATLGLPASLADHLEGADEVEIWAEHWPAVRVFESLSTQWRVGMAGPTGLDYAALPAVMDLLGIDDRAAVFDDLRILERAALEELTRKN